MSWAGQYASAPPPAKLRHGDCILGLKPARKRADLAAFRPERQDSMPAQDPAGRPDVTIVIPVYGKLELTRACVASLEAAPAAASFEIVVVDNASPDGTGRLAARGRRPWPPARPLQPGERRLRHRLQPGRGRGPGPAPALPEQRHRGHPRLARSPGRHPGPGSARGRGGRPPALSRRHHPARGRGAGGGAPARGRDPRRHAPGPAQAGRRSGGEPCPSGCRRSRPR